MALYNAKTRETVQVMDIDFINVTKQDFVNEYLMPRLKNREKSFVVTANPEIVMKTRDDANFKEMVQQADYVVPDGAGIIMASKYMGTPIKERVPGFLRNSFSFLKKVISISLLSIFSSIILVIVSRLSILISFIFVI